MASLRLSMRLSLVFSIVAAAECVGEAPVAAEDTTTAGKGIAVVALFCVVAWFLFVPLRFILGAPPRRVEKGQVFSSDEIERSFPEVQISDTPMCVICLASVGEEERGRRLQCSHEFHADCILKWWTHCPRSSLDCPTCRQTQTLTNQAQASDCGQP